MPRIRKTPTYENGMELGERVKYLRQQLKMTQFQLWAATGISQPVLSTIERAKDTDVLMSTLKRLAAGLECELIVLLRPKWRKVPKDVTFPRDQEIAGSLAGWRRVPQPQEPAVETVAAGRKLAVST